MKTSIIITILALLLLAACAQTQEVKPYKFGAVLPLTGSNAFYGEFTKYGFELALEDINKAGGVNGRHLEIVYEDSAGDKAKATTAAQKLINIDGVSALLSVTTPMGGAIGPVAEENKIPFIYASAANSFAEGKKYVFKDYPDASDMCEILMRQALKDDHKVAFFGIDGEQTQLCKLGAEKAGKLVSFEKYVFGESDYRTQFTKIKDSGATALMLFAFAPDCPGAYKQMRELNLKLQIYLPGQQFTCGSKEATKAGTDLLMNAYGADIALNEDSTDPKFLEFKKRLEEKGWTTQFAGSAMLYDSAIEMAKSFEGCEDSLCISDNLRSLNYKGISGHIAYNGDQIVEREIMLTQYKDGKWRKVA